MAASQPLDDSSFGMQPSAAFFLVQEAKVG